MKHNASFELSRCHRDRALEYGYAAVCSVHGLGSGQLRSGFGLIGLI